MTDMLHEVVINATLSRVYDAITTESGLKHWWTADTEAEPQVESVAQFGFGDRSFVLKMRIEELNPAGSVQWVCVGDADEWKGTCLRFDLADEDGKTRVRFTHAGWRSTDGMFASCNTTWGTLMNRLKDYVEGRSTEPFFSGKAD